MARAYRAELPYTTAIELLIPTYENIKGVRTKVWPEEGIRLNCSFKTYGGTEAQVNGVYSLIDTANVETWYRPDIKADCRIKILGNGALYEIINTPEDIEMRHQFSKFKVQAVKGKV